MAKAAKKGSTVTTAAASVAGAAAPAALNFAVLVAIATATRAGNIHFVSQTDGLPLVNEGLIVVNGAQADPTDNTKVAAYLTEAGSKLVAEHEGPAAGFHGAGTTGTQPAPADAYEIEDIPLPTKKRGGGGAIGKKGPPKYPFDKLSVGQTFHVAATEKVPNPARTLNSAVSLATKSYDEPELDAAGNQQNETVAVKKRNAEGAIVETGENVTRIKMKHTRVFSIVSVDETDPKGPGARIGRLS